MLTTAGFDWSIIGANVGISPLLLNQLLGRAACATWMIRLNAASQIKLVFNLVISVSYCLAYKSSSASRGLKFNSSAICW